MPNTHSDNNDTLAQTMPSSAAKALDDSSHARAALAFLLMSASFIFLAIGPQVYPVEIVLLLIAFFSRTQQMSSSQLVPGWVSVTLLAWLCGTLMTDLARGTDVGDMIRGCSRVIFFGTNAYALMYLVAGRVRVLLAAWCGVAVAGILAFFVAPSAQALMEPWKFGYGYAVTLIAVLMMARLNRVPSTTLGMLTLAALNFILGFRSLAVFCLFGLTVMLLRARSAGKARTTSRGTGSSAKLRSVVTALGCIAVGVGVVRGYDVLALKGALGPRQQFKAQFQSVGSWGSLLGARTEIVLSVREVMHHPLVGGGSYSTASMASVTDAAQFYSEQGYQVIAQGLLTKSREYHSRILGLWAENGLLALPIWTGILFVSIRTIRETLESRIAALPLFAAFIATQVCWDAFFSPFGASDRILTALQLVTLITLRGGNDDAH